MAATQGPWGRNIKPASKYPIIYAGRNTHVAQVLTRGLPEDEQEGNANLISAAPQLLDALKSAEGFMSGFEDDEMQEGINERLVEIRKAILKAEGKR